MVFVDTAYAAEGIWGTPPKKTTMFVEGFGEKGVLDPASTSVKL
jgi:hypothetical protein